MSRRKLKDINPKILEQIQKLGLIDDGLMTVVFNSDECAAESLKQSSGSRCISFYCQIFQSQIAAV